jgi:UDP-3-O-[3-hydroxymyristoyl] N-acetylglucosamine deacetylase
MKRRTVEKSYYFEGVGLHTGTECRILIAPSTKGIVFIKDGVSIPAHYTNVVNTKCCTVLGKGSTTIKHLMAALFVHFGLFCVYTNWY